MRSEILIAGLQLQNLSENAGFQQVAKLLPFDYVDSNRFPYSKADFGTAKKRINLTCYEAYLKSITNKYRLVHYIFPELHLTFSQPTDKKIISVGTIHLPLDWAFDDSAPEVSQRQNFTRQLRKKSFDRFDSLVTVTRANITEIKRAFPRADVLYIPHGVHDNSSYFSVKQSKDILDIIVVGSNYRDFSLMQQIVPFAREFKPAWKFHFVGAGKFKTELTHHSNAIVYPFLNEPEYLTLLANCDVHLLPLTFATANNAIVEAHSVGTPSLVTDLDSVKDYGIATTRYFSPSVKSAVSQLEHFESLDADQRILLKQQTLNEGKLFYWETIAKSLENYYQKLLLNS